MISDVLEESFETIKEMPREIGTEVVGQVKGGQKQANQNSTQQNMTGQQDQQNYLNDLYGVSEMTPEQIEMKKKQDGRIQINNYKKIQQDIQEYRAKKQQEKTKYEIGQQEGTETARDQEEEQELWQKQQEEAEKKKKKKEKEQKIAEQSGEKVGNKG